MAEQSDTPKHPALTAAGLDRLAAHRARLVGRVAIEKRDDGTAGLYFTSRGPCRQIVPLAETSAEYAPVIEAALNALPSLLALARRGLEADTAEQRMESALELVRHNAIRAESAESKLAAALAEVERVRGRLAAIPCASCSGRGEFDYCSMCSDSGHDHICPPARKCRDCAGTGKAFAAEAQAGQAAKQGGEGQT